MPELIAPDVRLHAAFLRCRADWGPGLHEDGFGLHRDDDVRSPDGFAVWVGQRMRLSHAPGEPCPAWQHGTARWIVEDGQVLGAISLRHLVDDETEEFGRIGYGVRPSARGRGLAAWALGEILTEAESMRPLLIVCLDDNVASARTIERNGGVLEDVRDTVHGRVRRYRL